MSKNYDMIATVDIDIASPLVDDNSFDNLLIVGPLPKEAPDTAPALVGAYSSLDEVIAAGWEVSGDTPDPVGVAARVAFSQSPMPTMIYIAPVQATEEGTAETAVSAITRAMNTAGWYIVCTAGIDPKEYESIAEYVETQEKMFYYTELEYFANGNKPGVGKNYLRTHGIYGRENSSQLAEDIPAENHYMNVAFAAKILNYEAGSETTAFKSLSLVHPSDLSTAEMNALKDSCITFFTTVGNKNITLGGKVLAGEWADIVRFRDWLKNDMQVRVMNAFVANPKIPYTDAGIGIVQNQMLASLKAGQDVGGIAEDEFDEDGNYIPGYSTSVPLSASISEVNKSARILPDLKFKARLAGAIHVADIKGSLTYKI